MISLLLGLATELLAPSSCAACVARIAPNRAFCAPCAATVERALPEPSCVAAFVYGGAIARAVSRFKYERAVDAGRALGRLFAQSAPTLVRGDVDLVVPIPLHPNRLAERGFNQAALLARPLARALDVRWSPSALVRMRDTARQVGLPRNARLANVEGAFRAGDEVRGASVLLVDDVLTTGATLATAAEALSRAGARRVTAAVVARAATP